MAATNNEVWQKGTVTAINQVAEAIKEFTIRQSNPAKAGAGSHIDLMISIDGEPIRRSYSVVSQSDDLSELTIAVFQVKNSRGGSIAMHNLTVGSYLDITQPIQNFPFRFGAKKYRLLAGGIGVTALVEMGQALKNSNADYEFHYVARSRKAMAYANELQVVHGDRLHVYIDDEESSISVSEFMSGVTSDTEVYLCGPIRLMDEVRRTWANSELDITNLRYETFGASGWFEPQDFVVRLPEKNAQVTVGKNQTIVEALEGAGLEVMADCRKGECGLCEARIIRHTGVLDHRDVFYSEAQKAEGEKIACCVSRMIGNGQTGSIDLILS
jgi:vanillate O-demethylase ferredoxin subunit